jgi:cysteine desulfurase / selenocysteine lyase
MKAKTMMEFDVSTVREDFPILNQQINGNPLVYFDNAATTQKPKIVIDKVAHFYSNDNSNVHRGVHTLSDRATLLYERARDKVGRFINAKTTRECIFVRGTTEAINLVAQSFVAPRILPGEEILITQMEHHSNIVPWQMVCKKTGALLRVVPITIEGEIDLDAFERMITSKTKFIALSHVSNALGTINPLEKMIAIAHDKDALVLVDGAQCAPHLNIDVQALDADFYAFSGHKMYAPTGIGVLYGREALLDDMMPYQGGGEMISYVTFEATEYAKLPQKFEAGTPNISGAIALGSAIDYLYSLDIDVVSNYEQKLLAYATAAIDSLKGFNIIGTANEKVPVISFVHGKIHAHDIGTILNSLGVAIRSGHHCAMPLMDFYDVAATTRISLAFYNTIEEVDQCMRALEKVKEVLG